MDSGLISALFYGAIAFLALVFMIRTTFEFLRERKTSEQLESKNNTAKKSTTESMSVSKPVIKPEIAKSNTNVENNKEIKPLKENTDNLSAKASIEKDLLEINKTVEALLSNKEDNNGSAKNKEQAEKVVENKVTENKSEPAVKPKDVNAGIAKDNIAKTETSTNQAISEKKSEEKPEEKILAEKIEEIIDKKAVKKEEKETKIDAEIITKQEEKQEEKEVKSVEIKPTEIKQVPEQVEDKEKMTEQTVAKEKEEVIENKEQTVKKEVAETKVEETKKEGKSKGTIEKESIDDIVNVLSKYLQ